MEAKQQSFSPAAGGLIRLFWTLLGNAALFILAVYSFERQAQSLSIFDGLYCLILVLTVLLRFIDIRWLKGETVFGQPASMTDFRKHVAVSLPVFLVLLGLAHLLGAVVA